MASVHAKFLENRKLTAWTALSFAAAFLFCIFAPAEAYYANSEEYWFSLGQLIGVCLPGFLMLFAVLEGTGLVLSARKAGDAVFALLLAVFVYFYIQGNFIPRDYGVLNGLKIDWNAYAGYGIASMAVGAACLTAGLVLLICFRDRMYRVGTGVCVFVLLILLFTLGTLMLQDGVKRQEEETIVTQEHAYELSKDSNLIVFVLDTYDAGYFEALLEQDGEHQKDIFENFTWYPDTLSAYPTTKAALPQILTGRWYENEEPYNDYVQRAWDESTVYRALRQEEYCAAGYTDASFLSEDETLLENTERGRYVIADRGAFAGSIVRLVLFNYMPHQLKHFFPVDTSVFRELKAAESGSPLFSADVVKFVRRFEEEGLNTDREGKSAHLYHLDGVHGPWTFGSALREDGGEYTATDEAAGNNELLAAWFQAMKEAGVYDSAAIVIMADHGCLAYDQNPLFLVKNAGERHAFAVSREEMSYEYLPQIWKALAEGKAVDEAFVLSCRPADGGRRFLYYSWDDAWKRTYMPGMEEMRCEGPAAEPESLKATGKSFFPGGENRRYRLGKTLEFISGRSAYPYVLYGFSYEAMMSEAMMAFDIAGKDRALTAEIEVTENSRPVPIAVYAGPRLIARLTFCHTGEPIRLLIPEGCIEDGQLKLRFVREDVGSEYAALTPSGVMLRRMKLSRAKAAGDIEAQLQSPRYEPGTVLGFTTEDPSGLVYVLGGFSNPEPTGTWTEGGEAALRLRLPEETAGDLTLRIGYASFHGEQRVRVLANGTPVAELTAAGE